MRLEAILNYLLAERFKSSFFCVLASWSWRRRIRTEMSQDPHADQPPSIQQGEWCGKDLKRLEVWDKLCETSDFHFNVFKEFDETRDLQRPVLFEAFLSSQTRILRHMALAPPHEGDVWASEVIKHRSPLYVFLLFWWRIIKTRAFKGSRAVTGGF